MRAAGDSETYTLHIIDQAGNPVGRPLELPSVTHILKTLPKNGLDWYGYKLGLRAARVMAAVGKPVESYPGDDLGIEELYAEAKRLGRKAAGSVVPTPYNVLAKAGARGTDIHTLAEGLILSGTLPDKAFVPVEQHGYVQSLSDWWQAIRDFMPNVEVVLCEGPVFSVRYWPGFAGTLDLILYDPDTGRFYVIDFKTSKGIYENHLIQVAAYCYAAIERGYFPSDADVLKCVVRFPENGSKAETKNSDATIEDFLVVQQTHEMLKRLTGEADQEKEAASETVAKARPAPAAT